MMGTGDFFADLAADLPAVHDGQHDIEQHEVGLDLLGHLDGLAAVGRVRDLEPVLCRYIRSNSAMLLSSSTTSTFWLM